jgi:hypothetical protein
MQLILNTGLIYFWWANELWSGVSNYLADETI